MSLNKVFDVLNQENQRRCAAERQHCFDAFTALDRATADAVVQDAISYIDDNYLSDVLVNTDIRRVSRPLIFPPWNKQMTAPYYFQISGEKRFTVKVYRGPCRTLLFKHQSSSLWLALLEAKRCILHDYDNHQSLNDSEATSDE